MSFHSQEQLFLPHLASCYELVPYRSKNLVWWCYHELAPPKQSLLKWSLHLSRSFNQKNEGFLAWIDLHITDCFCKAWVHTRAGAGYLHPKIQDKCHHLRVLQSLWLQARCHHPSTHGIWILEASGKSLSVWGLQYSKVFQFSQ